MRNLNLILDDILQNPPFEESDFSALVTIYKSLSFSPDDATVKRKYMAAVDKAWVDVSANQSAGFSYLVKGV